MNGKCLCGKVEFEFTPADGTAFNCFCSICQRSHGAGYATVVPSSLPSLKFISGEENVQCYESSTYGRRTYCKDCGARLFNQADPAVSKYLCVSMACVTPTPDIKVVANVHVASKAPWVTLPEGIANYDELPESFKKYL